MVAWTRRDGGFTVIGVQLDGSAETEAQSVQLRAQHSDSNIASCSTGNKPTKKKRVREHPKGDLMRSVGTDERSYTDELMMEVLLLTDFMWE